MIEHLFDFIKTSLCYNDADHVCTLSEKQCGRQRQYISLDITLQ